MKRTLQSLVLTTLLTAPMAALPVWAMDMDMDHGNVAASEKMVMEHSDEAAPMQMDADTVMLDAVTVDGIKALAHMKDIKAVMSEMHMAETHHFMVMFANADGHQIDSGVAALKITGPSGTTTDAIKLMGMTDGFGADVTLADKGKYTLEVGTKLNDGQKRKYVFNYTVQ